jgi:hypothetical protein
MCIAAPTAPATVILVNEGAKALRETKYCTSQITYEAAMPFLASGLFLLRMIKHMLYLTSRKHFNF